MTEKLRLELKVKAATLGEIAGALDAEGSRKIVIASPKNFFELRDLMLEAEATIVRLEEEVRVARHDAAALEEAIKQEFGLHFPIPGEN